MIESEESLNYHNLPLNSCLRVKPIRNVPIHLIIHVAMIFSYFCHHECFAFVLKFTFLLHK